MNPQDVDAVIQSVRFELYRENIAGALEIEFGSFFVSYTTDG